MSYVLVLYYSHTGATKKLAEKIALGVEQGGAAAMLRTVPPVSTNIDEKHSAVPDTGAPFVTLTDLANCSGLAIGSPTRFGNMAAAMKYFIDGTSQMWLKGSLIDKPACVFTSSSSLHGGQEATLLAMMLPLLHHGMVMVGLPYAEPDLASTRSGGTPYGVTHVTFGQASSQLTDEEERLCIAQGQRLAKIALALEH
ncbi:NAD(P)H:quinone oxidoreductase [Alteromonas sp. ASW11-36]|uniref:NAD(P)H:quinone oxidoreductase n=1 Tax=Alteromonas arenosi TaxID=3055817 RepID=A0ABT7SX90_9ALTE|nr:NAD(P)H:quinone oxidoreductase [Alteromonas sp. ASW11-36]MDM7860775.1 NAD(P)H:quinone oxidoreductase [Alteromonas sp. ASW11-36]